MCIVDSSLFAEKEPDMSTPFTVLMPANIRFGRGQAESAAPWLAQQGGPILLVHGAARSGRRFSASSWRRCSLRSRRWR